jgi:hypothetical protein
MPTKRRYKYFTEVASQQGPYIVKHTSKESMAQYEKALAEQAPYFVKRTHGKLLKEIDKRANERFKAIRKVK